MNYLAHAYLSFNNPEILAGNMISDFVKGKTKFDYQPGIQKGIQLHRSIDTFTDFHEATAMAKSFFRPQYRLYSGAFVDVAYDHFLANDSNEFSDASLRQHAWQTYQVLAAHNYSLPPVFQQMLPYMQSQNWLYNYKSMAGTESSFKGVVMRASYLNSSIGVFDLFQQHYNALQNCYNAFFPFVKAFSLLQIEQLMN